MAILNNFKQEKTGVSLEQLMQEQYKQKYFEECQYIWKTYVPKSGQSTVLQGELLRQIEKLRHEAQNNGNLNWDEDFKYFCHFVKDTLVKQDFLSQEQKEKIVVIMDYIESCGDYAVKFWDEEITDEEFEKITGMKFDIDRVAYVDDNLYDMVADAIGLMQKCHPEPITFTPNPEIIR